MSKTPRWMNAVVVVGVGLLMPLSTLAQSDAGPAEAASVPELAGLAWYRSHDLAGAELGAELPVAELEDWRTLATSAGASLDDLEYTYQRLFDPADLPELGGLATVRAAGADVDALRAAVIDDIVTQVATAGFEAPAVTTAVIADRNVTLIEMPDETGLEDAVVYASGDTAWTLLLPDELVEPALEQLP